MLHGLSLTSHCEDVFNTLFGAKWEGCEDVSYSVRSLVGRTIFDITRTVLY